MSLETRLSDMGLVLPVPPKPVAAYVPVIRGHGFAVTAGQIPVVDGQPIATGRVVRDVDVETAQACARQCVLNGLAALKAELGSLDAIERIIRIGVWVASDPDFYAQPKVADGASTLLVELFGDAGRHARAAVGSVALPLNVPVELELMVAI